MKTTLYFFCLLLRVREVLLSYNRFRLQLVSQPVITIGGRNEARIINKVSFAVQKLSAEKKFAQISKEKISL